jgi:hypothetical protein
MPKNKESFPSSPSDPEDIGQIPVEKTESTGNSNFDELLDLKPNEREMRMLRGKQLRESAAFRTFATILRKNPDIFGPVKQVLARRSEFMGKSALPGESHRDLTVKDRFF